MHSLGELLGIRTTAAVLLAVVMQVCLFAHTPMFGIAPDVVLLTAIGIGLAGGPERGAVAGFLGGFLFDCTVSTPFGLSALVYASTGYLVGGLQHTVLGTTWWTPLAVAGIASAAGTLAYGVLGALDGNLDWLNPHTVVLAVGVGVLNAVLAVVVLPLTRWSQGGTIDLSWVRVPDFVRLRTSRRRRGGRRRRPRGSW